MDERLRSTGVQLPETMIEELENVAESHGTTRSAAIRAAIDTGLRARKYPELGDLNPERHHRLTIAEQKARND